MPFESFHSITLGELLTAQAQRYADKNFFVSADQRWTYANAEKQA